MLVSINLWPWRDAQRKKKEGRCRKKLILISALCILPFVIWSIILCGQLMGAQQAVSASKHQLQLLPLPLLRKLYSQKQHLLEGHAVVANVKLTQMHLLGQLVLLSNALPEGSYLTQLHCGDGVIELKGRSIDSTIVGQYVSELRRLKQHVSLLSINRDQKNVVYRHSFVLAITGG